MTDEEKSFGDKVKEAVGYQKVVTMKLPVKVFERFSHLALSESNGCYWLLINRLMDVYDKDGDNASSVLLFRQLEKRLLDFEERLITIESKDDKHSERRTFGAK